VTNAREKMSAKNIVEPVDTCCSGLGDIPPAQRSTAASPGPHELGLRPPSGPQADWPAVVSKFPGASVLLLAWFRQWKKHTKRALKRVIRSSCNKFSLWVFLVSVNFWAGRPLRKKNRNRSDLQGNIYQLRTRKFFLFIILILKPR